MSPVIPIRSAPAEGCTDAPVLPNIIRERGSAKCSAA